MKAAVRVTLAEAAQILRDHLTAQLGVEIGEVAITSYDKPMIVFSDDGLVEATEFRHRAH